MKKIVNVFFNVVEYMFFPVAFVYGVLVLSYFLLGASLTTILFWMGVLLGVDLVAVIVLHIIYRQDFDLEDDYYE